MIVLAGDIGGTKSLLAIVDVGPMATRVLFERRYASREFDGLGLMLEQFLAEAGTREPDRACLGVPGIVTGDTCRAVNLPWPIHAVEIGHQIGIARTRLINDFMALGYGLDLLEAGDLVTLQAGRADPRGPKALLGAGTGLGESILLWDGTRYVVHATEGGHADFGPRNETEDRLCAWLRRQFGHVSWERVVSGPGLVNLYEFVVNTGLAPAVERVREEMGRDDPAAVISTHALAGDDPACVRALDLFIGAYGAEAGNLALKTLATGGVYVAGGIAPRLAEKLKQGAFVAAFKDKGRFASFLENIPVHVIHKKNVGLLGAAAEAARMK